MTSTSITWKCVFVGNRKDAERFVVWCASDGIAARLFADADNAKTKLKTYHTFHVAVPEADAAGPRVWLLSIRGSDGPAVCTGDRTVKHMSEG